MTEQEIMQVTIAGGDKLGLDRLRHRDSSVSNHRLQIGGKSCEGIQAIRHKKTGEIIVPSMYYAIATGTTVTYWDSTNGKTYTNGTFVKSTESWLSNFERWLKESSRESFDSYELIFIEMKAGKYMPYKYGWHYYNVEGNRVEIYHPGLAGLPRSVSNDIKKITVLQETYNVSSDEYEEQSTPHPRVRIVEPWTVKEV